MKFSLLLAMLAVLVGCSAVGVVESSDPAVKLKQAEDLWARQCRFLPAQGLIAEALDIYRARGDEMGVAEAYRIYGMFYRAPTQQCGRVIVPFDSDEGRYKLSKDYLTSALEIYERKQEYAWASNVYLSLAQNYATIDHDAAEACKMLDQSLAAHRKWMTIHPDAQVTLPRGVASYEELIKRTKDQVPCQAS